MENNELFRIYKQRMTLSAIVTSACCGLAAGGLAAFISALACWIFNFDSIWLPIGIGIGVAVTVGVLVYFLKLRPTPRKIAGKIDSMGLEERTITMLDLEGSESTMAQLQRSDAVSKISKVTGSQIKRAFPVFSLGFAASAGQTVAAYIGLGAATLAGAGMIVVQGLTGAGVIPSPGIIEDEREKFVTVSYVIEDGGMIMGGDEEQILLPGEDAETVTAEAEDGWAFLRWSDGNKNPTRTDTDVEEDLSVTAYFEEIGTGGDGSGDGDGSGTEGEGDFDQNAPDPDESEGGGNGQGGDGGEGDGSGNQGEGNGGGSGGEEGEGNGSGQGNGSGGGWSDSNNIIDGETPYRDVLEQYLEAMREQIANGTLPQELIDFIESYFNGL